jgi:antiviral helicase SLH1
MSKDPIQSFLDTLDQAAQSPAVSPPDLTAALILARQLISSLPSPRHSTPFPLPAHTLDLDPYTSHLHASTVASTSHTTTSITDLTGLEWLQSTLSPSFASQALQILQSPSSDSDIASSLLELYGYEGISKVGEAVTRRLEICSSARELSVGPTEPHGELDYGSTEQPARGVPPHLVRAGGGRTPQAQIVFKSTEELKAAKRARKAGRGQKGKGREQEEEFDLEEWERIREESLARGPGALVSGKRVSET